MTDEYIEREAVFDAVFGQFCASSDETEQALNAVIDEIKAIPAADVVPVVRCGECKHSAVDFENMRYCKLETRYNHVPDDWFCADGE